MIVTDENGEKWEISKGEPAHQAVNKLAKIGYEEIILPLSVIVYGGRTDDLPWPKGVQYTPDTPDILFLHRCRLWEQSQVLQ